MEIFAVFQETEERLLEWFGLSRGQLYGVMGLLAILSVIMVVGAAVLVPVLIVKMPEDYFVRPEPPRPRWARRHPLLYLAWLTFRNIAGLFFVLIGIIQLFTPGQGVLCMLIGLSLMVFPGKRRLEGWLVGNRYVLRAVNAIRRRAHKPPLIPPRPAHKQEPHARTTPVARN